jgi:hypothetical protein
VVVIYPESPRRFLATNSAEPLLALQHRINLGGADAIQAAVPQVAIPDFAFRPLVVFLRALGLARLAAGLVGARPVGPAVEAGQILDLAASRATLLPCIAQSFAFNT